MIDSSFIDLTKEENLDKIRIDRNLIPMFKIAMRNFQRYFNYMGYTSTRDYKKYFEKYLTTRYSIRKVAIKNNYIINNDWLGLYDYNKREILIDTDSIENKTEILSVFTHEFIHFLVLHEFSEYHINCELIYNIFLDEALTELLKSKILPYTETSYLSIIKMLNFWLLINDKKIDFNMFLNDCEFYEIDSKLNELFIQYYIKYDINDYGYGNKGNKIDELYKEIQREIIKLIDVNVINLKEYENIAVKISKRPLNDKYFINRFYGKIEKNVISNLNINDKLEKYFRYYLKQYRITIENLTKLNNKIIAKYKIDGDKFELDKRGKLYKNEQFIKQINSINFKLKDGSDIKINVRNINHRKMKLIKENKNYKYKRSIDLKEYIYKDYWLKKKNYYETVLKYIKFVNDSEFEEKSEKIFKKS